MGDIAIAIINGIVEGLTEFLPVSSTGHMKLVDTLTGFAHDPRANTFDIVIQLGAILAVVVLYWRRLLPLFGLGPKRPAGTPKGPRLNLVHILIGILPAMIVGFLLDHYIEKVMSIPQMVLLAIIVGGIYMMVAERYHPPIVAETMDEITYKQAFYIGLTQILSLWSGFSRSGSTIAGGMFTGVSRAAAADFSFIMAIPIMFAASGYKLLQTYKDFSSQDVVFFAVGFVISFLVALLAVATFIKFVQKMKLTYFSYYRFILAAVFILYMLLVGLE